MNQSDSKYMAAAANRGKIYDLVSRKLEQRSITTTATKTGQNDYSGEARQK